MRIKEPRDIGSVKHELDQGIEKNLKEYDEETKQKVLEAESDSVALAAIIRSYVERPSLSSNGGVNNMSSDDLKRILTSGNKDGLTHLEEALRDELDKTFKEGRGYDREGMWRLKVSADEQKTIELVYAWASLIAIQEAEDDGTKLGPEWDQIGKEASDFVDESGYIEGLDGLKSVVQAYRSAFYNSDPGGNEISDEETHLIYSKGLASLATLLSGINGQTLVLRNNRSIVEGYEFTGLKEWRAPQRLD